MKAVFLVFSPFQMLNAVEARHSLQKATDECHLVYFRGVSERNAEQIRAMIDVNDWHSVTYISEPELPSTLRRRKNHLEKFYKSINGIDRLVVGHFGFPIGRHLSHRFRPAEVIILDDGTASHRTFENRFSTSIAAGGKALAFYKRLPFFNAFRRLLTGVNSQPYKAVTFFSIYRHSVHSCDRLLHNNYTYLRQGKTHAIQNGTVFFLGGCLVELGIITEENYTALADKAARIYENHQVVYIPHRREDPDRLQKLQEKTGWKIQGLDVPIELFLLRSTALPSILASFYSTALDSCFILFQENSMKFHSFLIPHEFFLKDEDRNFSDQIYTYYRGYDSNRFTLWTADGTKIGAQNNGIKEHTSQTC